PLHAGMEPIPGYRLRRRRGSGGFGEVWEAVAPQGQEIALKFIASNAQRAATQEVRSLQAIRQLWHPHLLRIDQVWCHCGYIIIAMELADGSLADLFEVYRSEYGIPIPVSHACDWLLQAAKGLDYLNERRHEVNGVRVAVQHCDVKPSNLLVVGDVIKVADFGLSVWSSAGQRDFRRAGT